MFVMCNFWRNCSSLTALLQVWTRILNIKARRMEFKVETITAGDGKSYPKTGDICEMHYTGTLLDGTQFDCSRTKGRTFKFTLGVGQVIEAWDEGVAKMSKGELVLVLELCEMNRLLRVLFCTTTGHSSTHRRREGNHPCPVFQGIRGSWCGRRDPSQRGPEIRRRTYRLQNALERRGRGLRSCLSVQCMMALARMNLSACASRLWTMFST